MFPEVGPSFAPLYRFFLLPRVHAPRFSFPAVVLLIATFAFAVPQTWGSTTTTLALTAGGNAVSTVSSGSVVTLTAGVVAGALPITRGKVNFCDATAAHCTDVHILGSAQITSAGTAVYRLAPSVGTHSYKAIFVGTNTNPGSSSAAQTLMVTGLLPTSTNLNSQGAPGNYSLYATVQTSKNAHSPTGQLSFIDTSNGDMSVGSSPIMNSKLFNEFLGGGHNPLIGSSVAAGDLNGDGKIDIVASDGLGDLGVALGAGDGTFSAISNAQFDASVLGGKIVVGDFNGDGKADLASLGTSNHVGIFLGNGDGSFTAAVEPATGTQPGDIAVGDFNGDGLLDIAIANVATSNMTILLGNGDGTFQVVPSDFPTAPSPESIASADFNGDGILDLAILTSDTTVNVFTGNGDGTFSNSRQAITNTGLLSIITGDFNGDGEPDLAIGTSNTGPGSLGLLLIYLNQGGGTFAATPDSQSSVNNKPGMMVVEDFDGDGNADIGIAANPAFSSYSPQMSAVFGDGHGNFGDDYYVTAPAISIASADFDGDGYPDILSVDATGSDGATPLITFSRPTQSLMAVLTNLSISGIGAHLVAATYAADVNFGGSTSNTVTLIAKTVPPTLTLTAMPTTSIYGQQISLTAALSPYSAAAQASDGDTLTFYQGTSNLGSAIINPVTGSATLNVTSLPAGVDALSAVFGGDTNFLAANSASLPFTVAQASPLVNWFPEAITYGLPLSSISLDATASVPGSFVYTPAAGAIFSAGNQTLSVVFTPNDTTDYTTSMATATLVVNRAPLTVTGTNATRAYGQANPALSASVSGAVNNDVLTASATTIATATSPPGNYSIIPAAAGTALTNYALQAVNGTLTVTKAPTMIALTASAATIVVGTSVSFTATVTTTAGSPTGSLAFLNGATLLGTVPLTGLAATYSVTALPIGANTITAVYSGDTNFATSTSSILTETVTGVPDFALTANPSSLTIKQGQSATIGITLTPINGYSQAVSFACGPLPSLATCAFAPSSLTPNGSPVTTQLTISTAAPTTSMLQGPWIKRDWPRGGAMPVTVGVLLCLLPFAGRRRLHSLRLFALLTVVVLMPLTGCGDPGSSDITTTTTSPGTPPGTSQITITGATSSGAAHVFTLSITVTN